LRQWVGNQERFFRSPNMPSNHSKLAMVAVVTLATAMPFALGRKKDKASHAAEMDERKRALHALNRLTFGPRPGDLKRVTSIGVDQWIDQQLHPERIDDKALELRLAPFRTLRMSTREIVENFPPPQVITELANGRRLLPSDAAKRAIYEDEMERLAEKQERKEVAVDTSFDKTGSNDKLTDDAKAASQQPIAGEKVQQLLELTPDQRAKEVLKMSPENRLALSRILKPGKETDFLDGMTPLQRETMLALNNPQEVVLDELVEGKILRATYSDRQLQEVMTDFWFNHFNVYLGKGPERYFLASYERDVIRPRSMGKFEDLLLATAQSPAMLFYLDNWLSVGPDSDVARGVPKNGIGSWRRRVSLIQPPKSAKARNDGLNENYGRELMELHTLGVNGGYTQKDVTEVARVFTGWTLKRPRDGGGFTFNERMHEPGDKIVLGHHIKSNGEEQGREVLHILAHHPSTAKFICTKLAMRFVSDDPPPVLVDRMAKTFLKKNGDIREVLKTMFRSPEFWSNDAYRAKVKTPLEFMVSSLRASDADVTDALPVVRRLRELGMAPYGMQPPTGYSMKAASWVNSSALLGRMNFALTLAAGKLRGTQVNWQNVLGGEPVTDAHQALAELEDDLLAGDISQQTHDTIAARLNDPHVSRRRLDDPARTPNIELLSGLILGSPEFQRR